MHEIKRMCGNRKLPKFVIGGGYVLACSTISHILVLFHIFWIQYDAPRDCTLLAAGKLDLLNGHLRIKDAPVVEGGEEAR
jgi:hypothetical protein